LRQDSVNAVMAHSKFVNEDVKLRLFESFALPLLTYSLNVLFLIGTVFCTNKA